jgi:hypothetical protein
MANGHSLRQMDGFAAVTVVFCLMLWPLVVEAAEKEPPLGPPTAEVEAEGEVLARPDRAILNFSVENQAAEAKEAAAANARGTEQFLGAMKPVLKPEEKLKTLSYQVVPIHKQVEKGQGRDKVVSQEVAGYRVAHRFLVELNDLTRIGAIIDAALKHGATRVGGPYYEHSRQEELQRQAAVLALQRARSLAEALAKEAGLKVKGLRKVATGHTIRPLKTAPLRAAAMTAPEPETIIEVGEEKFQARLTATFDLAP